MASLLYHLIVKIDESAFIDTDDINQYFEGVAESVSLDSSDYELPDLNSNSNNYGELDIIIGFEYDSDRFSFMTELESRSKSNYPIISVTED